MFAELKKPSNAVFISAVCLWEISLKFALGKLSLDQITPDALRLSAVDMGFALMPLLPEEASGFDNLPRSGHKDSFDRMLVWQAIHNKHQFVSCDAALDVYKVQGLKRFWPE
ncbi:MAG TPA: type II toxin-antitoxin system VapC family toxin [Kiritimatiellia bacterium]|nr:type II toxin-antitoxin system VapC family toxin [Kiritimatiellia bacterium]